MFNFPFPFRVGLCLLVCATFVFVNSRADAQRTQDSRIIFLEISADSRSQIGTEQKWIQMLSEVGADRVISKQRGSGTPTVEEQKGVTGTTITVTGFIVKGRLRLPGGTFSIRDKGRIRALLQKLRDDGSEVALAEKKAFGLTSKQLVGLHQKLATKVDFETRGKKAGEVVRKIVAGQPSLRFVMDPAAKAAMAGSEKVATEMKGVSTGTAIANIIRPLGLVLQPKREQGGSLELHIVDSRSSKEHWPVGWPIERPPVAIEPKLFERLDIEIRNFPMQDAMNAVEKRSGVPFFYDFNTMAREGIEMSEVKVTLVQNKASIMVAISKLLRQTKPRLSDELRVDENGKAFLWITVK